jgi:hypothetical protein
MSRPPKHPGAKLRGRQTPDAAYVDTLRRHGGWMSAREVASAHGHSWYVVSHALRRQAEAMLLEEDVIEVVGVKRIREHRRIYRARPVAGEFRRVETLLPGWLAPQGIAAVGVARLVEGRAGIRRWDEEEDQEGIPGGPEKGAQSTNGSSAGAAMGDGLERLVEAFAE